MWRNLWNAVSPDVGPTQTVYNFSDFPRSQQQLQEFSQRMSDFEEEMEEEEYEIEVMTADDEQDGQ